MLSLYTGDNETLTATLTPAGATSTITWSSNHEEIATVTQSGVVTGVASGEATITATANGHSASCTVTVSIEHGTIQSDPLTAAEANAIGLALPSNGSETNKTYFVNGFVHQIISNYDNEHTSATFWLAKSSTEIKGFEGYNVTLADGLNAENMRIGAEVIIRCKIKKYNNSTIENASGGQIVSLAYADRPTTAIVLNKNVITLGITGSVTLSASITPVYSTDSVNWTSEFENIATVNNGTVSGAAIGVTTITVTSGSFSATCQAIVATISSATYSLKKINNSNSTYTKVYDVSFSDGKQWSIPGNQSIDAGLKIGGTSMKDTPASRVLYSKSSYDTVSEIIVMHGDKDLQATVSSLTLYVYDSADGAAEGDANNAVETVAVSYSANDIASFKPTNEGTTWDSKYFRIVYNISASVNSSVGIYLTELKLNFLTPKNTHFESTASFATIRGTEDNGVPTSVSLGFGAKISKADWDAINASWPITDYGVMLVKENTLTNTYSKSSVEKAFIYEKTLAKVNKGSGAAPYLSGNDYVFTIKVNIVDGEGHLNPSDYGTVYCAAPYIVAGGEYYFFNEMRYSVNTLATYCLANEGGDSNLSTTALNSLLPQA